MIPATGMGMAQRIFGHGRFVIYKGSQRSGAWFWRDGETDQVHGPFKTRREALDDLEAEVGNV